VAGYDQKSLRDRLLPVVRPGRDAVRVAACPGEQPFSRPWRDWTLRFLLTHH